jgi:hypothetical protein
MKNNKENPELKQAMNEATKTIEDSVKMLKKANKMIKLYWKLFNVLELIIRILVRIIVFPLLLAATLFYYLKNWIVFNLHCLFFGSELLAYSKNINPKTFGKVIQDLINQQNKSHE